jgi:predicted nucleic acid-binding protein
MARSTRSLSRSVVAFDAPGWLPPERAVIDTNVIAEAMVETEDEHVQCARLVDDLIEHRTTVVFSRLLEIELWESVFNLGLKMQHPRAA